MEGEVVVVIAIFVIVFSFAAFTRFLRYKETLALVERGLVRPPRPRGNGKDTLRWGIIITAVGLGLCIGLYPIGFLGSLRNQFPLYFGPWMLLGLIPTFFGLGLILIYVLIGEDKRPGTGDEPGEE